MARYWCKSCELFVDDNKISRKNHEESAKHKNSVIRSISKLHRKNKDEHRQKILAEEELRTIRKELGINPGARSRPKATKAEKKPADEEKPEIKEPLVGEWTVVDTSSEVVTNIQPQEEQVKKTHSNLPKKQSAGDLEVKNWDLMQKKQLDTPLSDSDEDKPKTTLFKKRKIKK